MEIETIRCNEPSRPLNVEYELVPPLWAELDAKLREPWTKLSRREIEERLNANQRKED